MEDRDGRCTLVQWSSVRVVSEAGTIVSDTRDEVQSEFPFIANSAKM